MNVRTNILAHSRQKTSHPFLALLRPTILVSYVLSIYVPTVRYWHQPPHLFPLPASRLTVP